MGKAPAYALCAPGGRSRTRGFLCALALGCLVGGDAIGSHSSHRPRSLWLQKRDSGKCVLRLSGGSAAVGSEPKLDEVPGSPTRSEARRAFDFLSQDLNDALAQAEGEAVGGKQLFFGDEEKARSLAARLDAISEGVTPPPETAKPEAASTWDPPKGNQPQDVEGIVPPLDLAGEADPAAAPKDAAPADGKSGAQRYFEETGVNITATAGAIAAYRAAVLPTRLCPAAPRGSSARGHFTSAHAPQHSPSPPKEGGAHLRRATHNPPPPTAARAGHGHESLVHGRPLRGQVRKSARPRRRALPSQTSRNGSLRWSGGLRRGQGAPAERRFCSWRTVPAARR